MKLCGLKLRAMDRLHGQRGPLHAAFQPLPVQRLTRPLRQHRQRAQGAHLQPWCRTVVESVRGRAVFLREAAIGHLQVTQIPPHPRNGFIQASRAHRRLFNQFLTTMQADGKLIRAWLPEMKRREARVLYLSLQSNLMNELHPGL
ncbi:MAG: hypothetical protein DCC66_09515 [Planctomycetota bacterium]|nr:MAG: hypothetical protein DCC66_09515 [Planctomycetota bacterium]